MLFVELFGKPTVEEEKERGSFDLRMVVGRMRRVASVAQRDMSRVCHTVPYKVV